MIENLPSHISVVFGLATLLTLGLFYLAIKRSKSETTRVTAVKITLCLIFWLVLQMVLTFQNVYNTNTNAFPPKLFLFGFLPNIILLAAIFITKTGRDFADSLPLANITYINIVRIPVELVLYWLFLSKAVPELMTFAGRNFDILAGLTAPIMAYFGFTKRQLSKQLLLIWNISCLGLLVNIVANAILSVPFPFQQFAFDQPDIAILNFPFSWLPTFIVPIVLFGHLVSIRQLLKRQPPIQNP
ncbi:MAG TPA: hypothetical protein VK623_10460 [Flavobacterium sp.]|nr:hypothetical protein [Flavobacterium sp.]